MKTRKISRETSPEWIWIKCINYSCRVAKFNLPLLPRLCLERLLIAVSRLAWQKIKTKWMRVSDGFESEIRWRRRLIKTTARGGKRNKKDETEENLFDCMKVNNIAQVGWERMVLFVGWDPFWMHVYENSEFLGDDNNAKKIFLIAWWVQFSSRQSKVPLK